MRLSLVCLFLFAVASSATVAGVLNRGGGRSVVQQAYLKASKVARGQRLGESVAIAGDTIVVGAPGADQVYVFVNQRGAWSQQAILQSPNRKDGDRFGESVAIDGDTIVVGAPRELSATTGINGSTADDRATSLGAAYVYVRRAGVWRQEARLKASNASQGGHFGTSVAISGESIFVGAPDEDTLAAGSGAAFVFRRGGGTWVQEAYLKASTVGEYDHFGISVAASGDTLVVGAHYESSAATGVNGDQSDNSLTVAGAAYVFVRDAGVWSQEAYLKASKPTEFDEFGSCVAISGDTVFVGAPEAGTANGAGAVYVFERQSGSWRQKAYVEASNAGAADGFGSSMAAFRDTLVVGAPFESSQSSGINGNQLDNGNTASGAAYVFLKTGGSWIQTDYVKASNSAASHIFGSAVGVSGSHFVVGAPFESNSSPGIDGDQFNDRTPSSGAAYVFRFGPPEAKLTVVQSPDPFDPTRISGSREQPLVIRNTGSEPLRGLSLRTFGAAGRDFGVRGSVSRTLAPGRMSRMAVFFRPTRPGLRNATISLSGNFRTTRVKLSGEGRPSAPRTPMGLR